MKWYSNLMWRMAMVRKMRMLPLLREVAQNIDRNVEVVLTHNDATIEWYNNKYMLDAPLKYQKLGDQFCSFPSMSTTIKAGDVYSRLPFTVETSGLDCDKLYALTFKIESVSDYVKQPKDTVLIMNLNLTNDFFRDLSDGSHQIYVD